MEANYRWRRFLAPLFDRIADKQMELNRFDCPSPGGLLIPLSLAICLVATEALAISEVVIINPQSPTNLPFGTGGPAALLNDPFAYDPVQDYSNALFLTGATQRLDIPQTAYGGGAIDTFMTRRNGGLNLGTNASNFVNVDIQLNPDQSFDYLDLWGRTDHSPGEEDRHQELTITFYDAPGGSAGAGSILGSLPHFNEVSAKDGSNTPGSAYGRLDVASVLDPTSRRGVQSFEIDHVGSDKFLLIMEMRAASLSGVGPGAQPVLTVDRATGEIRLVNESIDGSSFAFSAYSIVSESGGSLVPTRWDSIAATGDADSGGSIDSEDRWIEFSGPDSTRDLSEAADPVGGGVSLAMGESFSLGRAWRRGSTADLSIQLVDGNEFAIDAEVRYVNEFLPGDYDQNRVVEPADYERWRDTYGRTGNNLEADGNLDGVVNAADYTVWRDGLVTPSSLAIPEPSSLIGMLSTLLAIGLLSERSHRIPRGTPPSSVCSLSRNHRYHQSLVAHTIVVGGLLAYQPAATAQTIIETGNKIVRLEKVIGGLNGSLSGNTANTRTQFIPIDLSPLGNGQNLILTLSGHVRLQQADGTLALGAYLDTTNSRTPSPNAQDFTQIGATSIATHPGFLDPLSRGYGKFYTVTSERAGTGIAADFSLNLSQGGNHVVDSVVNEWTVSPAMIGVADQLRYTPDLGSVDDTVSVREVLRSQRPGIIHTLADIAFDSNQNLLITSGDGGGNAFPNSDGSANGQSRTENSLDPTNIFGSILRIDPLELPNDTRVTGGVNGQYRIPHDNFFAIDNDPDTPAEFFAYGFRSPYRLSVDEATNRVFIGDVGEASREEINEVQNGGNYGWGGFEGTRINDLGLANAAINPLDPTFELYHNLGGHSEAVNVVGGFIYRGEALPELQGKYIFADTGEDEFTQSTNVLDLFYGDPDTSDASTRDDFFRLQLELPDGLPDRVWSLAEDADGEILLLVGPERIDLFDLSEGETDGGVWRVAPAVSRPLSGVDGDVNQDGLVNGDGTGIAAVDDVTAFAEGWLSSDHETLFDQVSNGDLNLDGVTNLADWVILRANHENGAQLSLARLLETSIPEPTTLVLISLTILSPPRRRRS